MQRFTAVIGNPSSLYIPDCSEEPGRSNQQITQMNEHLKKDIKRNMGDKCFIKWKSVANERNGKRSSLFQL